MTSTRRRSSPGRCRARTGTWQAHVVDEAGRQRAWQLFDGIGMSLSEALRAAGDTTWPLWARVVIAWVLFVPLSWLVVRVLEGGPVGAMLCLVFYLGALSLALFWRFRSGAWRSIDLTGAPPLVFTTMQVADSGLSTRKQ